jgi:hypothetical protein
MAMFEMMPPAVTLVQSIQFEKKWFAGWIVPKLKAEEQRQKGAGLALWRNFLDGPDTPASLKEIKTLDEAIKLIEEMIPTYDELARYAALPNDQFDAQYPAVDRFTPGQGATPPGPHGHADGRNRRH